MDILNRKQIAPGIFLSSVTDPRFKQNRVSVNFLTQLNEAQSSANAAVGKILTNSCRLFPDLRSLNTRLSALYAASLSERSENLGDTQCISVSIKTVDSVYALEGEDVTGDGVGVLLNCLLDPLLEGGGFKPSVTETEKQSCVDQIEAELNDKRVYAFRRASQIMFEGEPAAVHAHGTVEGVKAVTPESAYKAYQNLLRTARIEIVCVGCNDFISVRNTLSDAFSDIERGETENCRSDPSLLKKEILTREEKIDVSQSKMVLGFKSDCPDSDALTLMAKIYGGSPTSKLFENVREKMSLCYYCWAKFFFNKRIILCECGVEKDNIETAKKEILSQFDLMRSSDFTDEEIGHAALSLQNDLRIFNDSLSGVKAWYLDHIYRCDIITPEQAIERYKQVTRERIVKAAESVSLDTVYILTSE